MKPIAFILLNSLQAIMQLTEDLCQTFMSHFGLLRSVINRDNSSFHNKGRLGNKVYVNSLGKSLIRSRPSHFNIKDPAKWENRWSKFSASFNLARSMNHDLSSLFQGNPQKRTWFHFLSSQLSKFWVKQPDGKFLFSPGFRDVIIGKGTLPDACMVVFSSPSKNTLKISFDNTITYPSEKEDNTLQLMFISQNGDNSFWADLTSVTRSSGTATYTIPVSFGTQIYPSVKFKSVINNTEDIKGIFHFPHGMQPVSILR